MKPLSLILALATAITGTLAVSTFTPARPPALPIAVRSPYLNTWLDAGTDGGNGGYLAGKWMSHWNNDVTAWAGLIRVDGRTYVWMGNPQVDHSTLTLVDQVSCVYTASRTVFVLHAGDEVELTVTFTSPVYPTDYRRQSLSMSYMSVDVKSIDGTSHDVQLYTDISGEWVSGNSDSIIQWAHGTDGTINRHKLWRQTQLEFTETNDRAEWGDWFFGTDDSDSLSYQQDPDKTVRGRFASTGALDNTTDGDYRAINDNWPCFAFAWGLGSVSDNASSVLLSLGHFQEYAVQFNGTDGYEPLFSLWKNYYPGPEEGVYKFHTDYSEAKKAVAAFDSKIDTASGAAAGQDYAAITTLSVRQAFGAMIPVYRNQSKTYWFQKELSSSGNVNTVDVIFPSFPIILYTNPTILKELLDPLFENQESGAYPNTYAMHDVGTHFPNATGHPLGDDEEMPVEECANMLIMALAYAQRAKDNSYLYLHYPKLKQWVEYLIEDSLIPERQLSTDDFAGHLENQTNLALKGIIGIGAMAEIAKLANITDDSKNYSAIAKDYIGKWQDYGIAKNADPPHTTLQYGNDDSHGLLYNLYADKLLGLDLVPSEVYDMQSKFYPTVENKYGVPLDTRDTRTKTDWEMFAAAISSDSTRDMFIRDIAAWINDTPNSRPMTDLYDTNTGDYPDGDPHFIARPVLGGTFAILALGDSQDQKTPRALLDFGAMFNIRAAVVSDGVTINIDT